MKKVDRKKKTEHLVARWMHEDGITSRLEEIYQSMRSLVRGIFDKVSDKKLDTLFEEITSGDEDETVSNNDNTNSD